MPASAQVRGAMATVRGPSLDIGAGAGYSSISPHHREARTPFRWPVPGEDQLFSNSPLMRAQDLTLGKRKE